MYKFHYKRPLWVWAIYALLFLFLCIFLSFLGYVVFSLSVWAINIGDMNWQPVKYAFSKSFQLKKNFSDDIVKMAIVGILTFISFMGIKKTSHMNNSRLAGLYNILLTLAMLIFMTLFFRFFSNILPYVSRTLSLAIFGVVIGFFIGLVAVAFRMSRFKILRTIGYIWVYIFRGTPFILQAYFIWNLSSLLLVVGFADFLAKISFYAYLPINSAFASLMPHSFEVIGDKTVALADFTNQFLRYWNQPYWWILLALAINSSAYGSEIIRGGLLSVDNKQLEAAKAYGMSKKQVFSRIRLKQAIAQALPAYSNEVILVLKATVVASAALSLIDFWDGYQKSASRYATVFAPLITIGIFYFLFNYGLARLFRLWEEKANPWIYKNQSY
ncbi:MAG: ABC transporter permease subunit [Alphaproteobacteria bacterium]